MNIRGTFFLAVALAAASLFAASAPPLAGEWNILPTGSAASSGDLLFRITRGDGSDPVEIEVPVMAGASDRAVAGNIRRALGAHLPNDRYLLDGGHYRQRRHSCFIVKDRAVEPVPQRPHWQSLEYNALHGGIERHFEPMATEWTGDAAWQSLLTGLGQCASRLLGAQPWYVEAHPFRITTAGGIGRPTPRSVLRSTRF